MSNNNYWIDLEDLPQRYIELIHDNCYAYDACDEELQILFNTWLDAREEPIVINNQELPVKPSVVYKVYAKFSYELDIMGFIMERAVVMIRPDETAKFCLVDGFVYGVLDVIDELEAIWEYEKKQEEKIKAEMEQAKIDEYMEKKLLK